eukprot:176611-Chlamydomonas_euryale.AAC.1
MSLSTPSSVSKWLVKACRNRASPSPHKHADQRAPPGHDSHHLVQLQCQLPPTSTPTLHLK